MSPTSGSTNFAVSRNEIVRLALLQCNGIEENEEVGTQQLQDACKFLNIFVKKINTRKPLWGMIDYTIPLYDSKQSYTIGPAGNKNVSRPLTLGKQARRVTGTNETPIDQISRDEYMGMPVKSSSGEANLFYYDPQLIKGVLYVWPVSSTASTSLSNGVTGPFKWEVSGTATEYFYTGTLTTKPYFVFINASGTMVEMTEGTAGSLSQYQYAWGDNDTIGHSTLYVWSATDPDLTSGSVKCLKTDPSKIIITANRPLEDFDNSTDTPDLPIEAAEMLVFNLAYRLAPMYDVQRVIALKTLADEYRTEYLSHDSEPVNLLIQPRSR
jgi:hypothetical protein